MSEKRLFIVTRGSGWWALVFVLLVPGLAQADSHVTSRDGAVVVDLTQTPCLFVESEADPQAYQSSKAADCEAINKETIGQRRIKLLRLSPGKVIFRVTNKNVPYELGFWVRGQGLGRVTLPSVSGGGLMQAQTREYTINLVKGAYWYSCPLNPTPNYPLFVD